MLQYADVAMIGRQNAISRRQASSLLSLSESFPSDRIQRAFPVPPSPATVLTTVSAIFPSVYAKSAILTGSTSTLILLSSHDLEKVPIASSSPPRSYTVANLPLCHLTFYLKQCLPTLVALLAPSTPCFSHARSCHTRRSRSLRLLTASKC